MKRMTLIEPEKIIAEEVPQPQAKPDELLLKIKYVGICGSDVHAYFGKHPFISTPVSLGHEFIGEVLEVGSEVKGFAVGDHVTAMPQLYCGHCELCAEGRYNICESLSVIGCQSEGAACEFFALKAELAKKIPAGLDLRSAALIEPIAVGVHALRRVDSIAGKNVVVLGAGTIGNVCAQAAAALGAKNVLITDLSEERLALARRCGLRHAVNTGERDLEEAMAECFDGAKADIFFECVGVAATVNQAIRLSKKGRDIVVLGVFEEMATVDMGLVQDKELRLIGSLMYTEADYDTTIELLAAGKVDARPLITAVFPFAEYERAFTLAADRSQPNLKILVEMA